MTPVQGIANGGHFDVLEGANELCMLRMVDHVVKKQR
jgi:hypothetical protein